MTVVITPFEAESVEELIRDEVADTPLIDAVRVLTAEASVVLLMKLAVVVATLPLTVDVRTKEFVEVEIVSVLEVEESVLEVVGLVIVVVANVEVPVTVSVPLIVVVNVLPESDCVNEEIRVTMEEETPLTIV